MIVSAQWEISKATGWILFSLGDFWDGANEEITTIGFYKEWEILLILGEDRNLVLKDNKITIWQSKTLDLWQGKVPYKLIIGKDGVMRILNRYDNIMSIINNENNHFNKNYSLQILNVGTFRVVNEFGNDIVKIWSISLIH